MSLILAAIYRDGLVLADYTNSSGTFEQIALETANKTKSGKNSYTQGSYVFHTLYDKGFVYLCMADINYMRADAYSFLEQLKKLLLEKCPQELSQKSVSYGLQKKLRADIKQKFDFFNSPDASKLRTAQYNLDILKDVIVQNLDKVLERNERLELIVQKSTQMTVASGNMKQQASAIRKQQQWKRIKLYIIIGVGSILIIYILLVIICGGFALKGCFGGSSDDNNNNNNDNNNDSNSSFLQLQPQQQDQQQSCPLSFLSKWTQKLQEMFGLEEANDQSENQQQQQQKDFSQQQQDLANKIEANLRGYEQNHQQRKDESLEKKIQQIKEQFENQEIQKIVQENIESYDQDVDLAELFSN